MRSSAFVFASLLIACGGTEGGDDDAPPITEDEPAFTIVSSDITVMPGEEFTKCFYFTTPNTDKVVVHKWVSDMTPGSHHMIMFRTLTGDQPADGTVDDCSGSTAVPIYGTQIPHEEIEFPDDDGFGKPLAQELFQTRGYFQMHYFNPGDEPLLAKVTVSAYALIPELAKNVGNYTKTDLVATYNNDIAIPPNAMNLTISATCPAIDGNIWQMSTHSHKQSMTTRVSEGGTMIFESADWEHPGDRRWSAPDFHRFETGQMTWECTYTNLGDNASRTIRAGQSAATDEMCMMTGYYFPATGPKGCVMDSGDCTCFL
jgi:hypothetical protein